MMVNYDLTVTRDLLFIIIFNVANLTDNDSRT